MAQELVHTYRARRRPEITPGNYREPGELVPEAHTWRLVLSLLHTGMLTEADVPVDEFRTAVDTFCPELAERIYFLTGLEDGVVLQGLQNSPVVQKRPCPDCDKEFVNVPRHRRKAHDVGVPLSERAG